MGGQSGTGPAYGAKMRSPGRMLHVLIIQVLTIYLLTIYLLTNLVLKTRKHGMVIVINKLWRRSAMSVQV